MTDHLLDRLVAAVGSQYSIDAEIGRGGMAVVYRATDLRLNRRVAVKLLPPELAFNADVRERFLREAQTSAQLAHPHIVPIYTVDEREGMVYFVMALVDGESLAERLKREHRLPIPDARRILADVADALAYAHERGVVHRDVKPDNIMLERGTGRAVVTDFGIARAAAADSRLTVTGVAVGTPAYMSPEQAIGERELDGRSDVYSLGVVAYQMLSGETPFRASNTPAMLVKHLSEAPRPLETLRPDAPAPLVHAIARALAKKPEHRWNDAAAFRAAISGLHDAPAFVDPVPAHRQPEPPAPAPAFYQSPFEDRDQRAARGGREPHQPHQPNHPHQLQPQAHQPHQPHQAPQQPPYQNFGHPQLPPLPPMPHFGSKAEWRAWRQQQRQWDEQRRRLEKQARREDKQGQGARRPVEERIANWQKETIGVITTIGGLATVNVLTSPGFMWFTIPGAFMFLHSVANAGKLWSDGVPLGRLFRRGSLSLDTPHAPALQGGSRVDELARRIAQSDEVLGGAYGGAVHRAAEDRISVEETLQRLAPSEREMIPDVAPTVVALSERIGSLALTLHRLDADVSGASTTSLDQRLTALRAEAGPSPTPEQERRIALLERQRGTIAELVERQGVLTSQLESAGLALQNLRLDLLKLRSSGLGNAMSDLSNATQEARAISRDIGHAVDAVSEVKRL